jgi:MFS family permease
MVTAFAAIVGLRLLLGVGESVAYPCYSKIIANNFAEHQRGLANALIDAGSKLGPAIGTFAGGMLMARFGWRPVFIVLGLGGLLWLPAWLRWMPRGQGRDQTRMIDVPSFVEILSRRPAWATFVGHFSGNYLWYFLITWLPFYLVRERGFSLGAMGGLSAMIYGSTAVATTLAGWLADRSIMAGTTPTRARKTCLIVGLTFAAPIVAVPFVPGAWAAIALLTVACLSYGVFASSHLAISQTIAGPVAAGKWTGLQNCVANMAGVTAPAITGLVVVAAAVVLVGAAGYAFFLGPVEPLRWRARSEPLPDEQGA